MNSLYALEKSGINARNYEL